MADFNQILVDLSRLNIQSSSDKEENATVIQDLLKRLSKAALPDPFEKKASTSLTIGAATDMLGIKYSQHSPEFTFNLRKGNDAEVQPSSWCSTAIDKIISSRHHQLFRDEPLSRTIIDLLICDRLLALDSDNAHKILQVATEVDIRAELLNSKKSSYNAGYVTGRADYTLGHGGLKANLEDILAVIEAKKDGYCSTAIAQTLCYLAGIQNAREWAGKINKGVFGIIADSTEFRFALLDSQRTAYVSRPLFWPSDRGRIVAFIDHILCSAIESSPNTTPVKFNNKRIMRHDASLGETFDIGSREGGTSIAASNSEDGQEEGQHARVTVDVEEYDVVTENGKLTVVPSFTAGQMMQE